MTKLLFWMLLIGLFPQLPAVAQGFMPQDLEKVREHAPWGAPAGNPWDGDMQYIARQGYVLAFDRKHGGRVPTWVAFKVAPDYLKKNVSRKGRFQTFRVDPDIAEAPRSNEYTGYHETRGFARGHLAPWAVMGGDRNEDGRYADEDEDDAKTLIESNYMANIAPQH